MKYYDIVLSEVMCYVKRCVERSDVLREVMCSVSNVLREVMCWVK